MTDSGELEWLATSKRLEPARLTLNGAYIKGRGNQRFNQVRAGGRKTGHTAWSAILQCEVKKGTPPGTYPLMISVTADNAERDNDTIPYEVVPTARSG